MTGLDTFKGEKIHSHDYKTYKGYEDKKIVVIGIGNSGGDAAVELSRVASQASKLFSSHSSDNRFFGISRWILQGKILNLHRISN